MSRQLGKSSNGRLPEAPQARALELVRERYADFGPTLALEKLRELHGVDVWRETLRKRMAGAGIWLTRDKRRARVPGDVEVRDAPAMVREDRKT